MMLFRKFKRGTALFLSILLTLTSVPFSSAADTVDLTVAEEKTGNSQEAVFKEKTGEEETGKEDAGKDESGKEDIVKEVTEIEEVKEDDSNTSFNEEPESENGTDRDKNIAEESLINGNANGSSGNTLLMPLSSETGTVNLEWFNLRNMYNKVSQKTAWSVLQAVQFSVYFFAFSLAEAISA